MHFLWTFLLCRRLQSEVYCILCAVIPSTTIAFTCSWLNSTFISFLLFGFCFDNLKNLQASLTLTWNVKLPQLLFGKSTNNFMVLTCDWHFLEFIDESMSSMKLYPDFKWLFENVKRFWLICFSQTRRNRSQHICILCRLKRSAKNNQTKNETKTMFTKQKWIRYQAHVMRI